ncbi:unnamed protein product [Caenorhabditis angaria]|uniref:Uncharacterized protein n=1 Tax=Caenorhabditis angaria TaxID=860376 RepID=A0A9P1J1Y8_9PELO|nr:unnamed protein product [Caenorhabditis angaria]
MAAAATSNTKTKNASNKEKAANKFYEEWMDYKEQERRSSIATTETVKSIKNNQGGKYKLYDEYQRKLSQTPTATTPPQPIISSPIKRQSLPIIHPIRERRTLSQASTRSSNKMVDWDNLDEDILEEIRKDFGPFYKWVKNGRTDDLKKEIIKKLLFKNK